MSDIERAILDRFKASLSKRVSVHRVVLFGSRARGDADVFSDMDVLVVLDGACDEEARSAVSDCAWEAGFEYGIVVVPIVYARDEWENGPERHSLLARAVEREGIAI